MSRRKRRDTWINPASGLPLLMHAQWATARALFPGHVILIRMGLFYEAWNEDADALSAAWDVAISFRTADPARPVPMVGWPVDRVDAALKKAAAAGLRVAVLEQTETPEQARARRAKLIDRAVLRVHPEPSQAGA